MKTVVVSSCSLSGGSEAGCKVTNAHLLTNGQFYLIISREEVFVFRAMGFLPSCFAWIASLRSSYYGSSILSLLLLGVGGGCDYRDQ
jgi:hypothetical protein